MSQQAFDVTIVGAGPFSCFSALLLAQNGMKIGLVYPEKTNPMDTFLTSLSACWPSLNDPPTRAEVAHGHEVASYLHQFCSKGLIFFKDILLPIIEDQDNWIQSNCLRIGIKDFEIEELFDAYKLEFGLKSTDQKNVYLEDHFSYLCLDKGHFKNKVIKSLEKNNITLIPSAVKKLIESQSKCTLELENTSSIVSEIVILGNSLDISKILPKFEKILIPMSDCLFEYEGSNTHDFKFSPISFRASNGHICGVIFSQNNKVQLKVSGPRFLLPGAGAGFNLTKVEIDNKVFQAVEKYHQEFVFDLLSKELKFASKAEFLTELPVSLVSKKIVVDCYPCDELPIIGEYGKLGRVLGNTGWLATGFSSGAWSAKIICDLVLNEKSSDLHPRLHPRRFFSLFSKT
jgi:hypothetical protein